MFDFDVHHSADSGLVEANQSAVVFPVACTVRPGQGYELLCTLATQLSAAGREVVIIDGSAQEVVLKRAGDGGHLGLVHALEDPSIAGLGAPGAGSDWLVMPGARGLQTLQKTARAAGAAIAVARMLAPFASSTMVLLYAPANNLSAILAGLQVSALVPVLDCPQATIESYGAVKVLHAAGLTPVLAPMVSEDLAARAPLGQVVRTVCDCAERYLNYRVEEWPQHAWSQGASLAAFSSPLPPGTELAQQAAYPMPHSGRANSLPKQTM